VGTWPTNADELNRYKLFSGSTDEVILVYGHFFTIILLIICIIYFTKCSNNLMLPLALYLLLLLDILIRFLPSYGYVMHA